MQKFQEVSSSLSNTIKLQGDKPSLIKISSNCKLLPVKSLRNLPTTKTSQSVPRKSSLNSKPSKNQLIKQHQNCLTQKSSQPKLPPLQSTLSRSIKRFSQYSMPSAKLIDEMNKILLKIPVFLHYSQGMINLEKPLGYENKKTIILDLDETLIHAEQDCSNSHISLEFGKRNKIGVNIRPFAQDLLKFASIEYEVIIFTASNRKYADSIINYLDPKGLYVHHRLYREHCCEIQGNYLKNIERIANRNLKDIVIVDNCPVSFCMQIDNGIPISSWYSDLRDIQLRLLIDYLKILANVNDVRVINQQFFAIKQQKI
jgi:CTD small phosphatase-like protein 2